MSDPFERNRQDGPPLPTNLPAALKEIQALRAVLFKTNDQLMKAVLRHLAETQRANQLQAALDLLRLPITKEP